MLLSSETTTVGRELAKPNMTSRSENFMVTGDYLNEYANGDDYHL
jgi:hypothetical protein